MFKLISFNIERPKSSIKVPSYEDILALEPENRGYIEPFMDLKAAQEILALVPGCLLLQYPQLTQDDLNGVIIELESSDSVEAIAGRPVYLPSVKFKFDLRGIHFYKITYSEDKREIKVSWVVYGKIGTTAPSF